MGEADPHEPVILVVALHFPRMWPMPRAFWRARALDHASRDRPGLLWLHRWISRRSVGFTSTWRDAEDARAWLTSEVFRNADDSLRRLGGGLRVEGSGALPAGPRLR